MIAKVIRYITKEKPDVPYKGEKGIAYPVSRDYYGVKFFNVSLGSGYFYKDELLINN